MFSRFHFHEKLITFLWLLLIFFSYQKWIPDEIVGQNHIYITHFWNAWNGLNIDTKTRICLFFSWNRWTLSKNSLQKCNKLMFFKNMCIIYKLLNQTTVGWTTGGFFVYQEYAYKYQMEGSFLDMQQCHPLTQKRTIG